MRKLKQFAAGDEIDPFVKIGRVSRQKERKLSSRTELSDFLAGAERRAFKQAFFAVRDEQAALDIVQDSMMRLAEKYGARPANELPMLFQRILQNAIRDWYRRQKVRSTWTSMLSIISPNKDDEDLDPLDTFVTEGGKRTPEDETQQSQVLALIEEAVSNLPLRQRQAFMLRYWEELDVAETAAAMGCSEGSVKTHCSRATHALAAALKAKGIEV